MKIKSLQTLLQIPTIAFVFVITVVFLGNFSGNFIPKHPTGGFPYVEYASRNLLPQFLKFLTNFDGTQYLIIAESGYFTYQQAYFPLYPGVSSLLGKNLLMNNIPLAMLLVNFISFTLGLWLLKKLLADKQFSENASFKKFGYLILLCLPGSFFFATAYTESIFMALFLASIYFTKNNNYALSFIAGFLVGLTRLIGMFASLVIFIVSSKKIGKFLRLFIAIGPVLGLSAYMLYLYTTTQDPLAFINAQKAFNNNRSTSVVLLPQVIYRYLKIIFTVKNFDIVYLVSIIEFAVFCIYGGLLTFESINLWRMWRSKKQIFEIRISLLVFSVINLILPTLTGTLSSLPRYGLMSFSIIPAISALNKYLRYALLLLLASVNILMLVLYAQGWFVS